MNVDIMFFFFILKPILQTNPTPQKPNQHINSPQPTTSPNNKPQQQTTRQTTTHKPKQTLTTPSQNHNKPPQQTTPPPKEISTKSPQFNKLKPAPQKQRLSPVLRIQFSTQSLPQIFLKKL